MHNARLTKGDFGIGTPNPEMPGQVFESVKPVDQLHAQQNEWQYTDREGKERDRHEDGPTPCAKRDDAAAKPFATDRFKPAGFVSDEPVGQPD